MVCGHICKGRTGRYIEGPAFCKDHYLRDLSSCGVVRRAESIVRVARDSTMAVQVRHSSVEVVCGQYVCERYHACCCSGRGRSTGGCPSDCYNRSRRACSNSRTCRCWC